MVLQVSFDPSFDRADILIDLNRVILRPPRAIEEVNIVDYKARDTEYDRSDVEVETIGRHDILVLYLAMRNKDRFRKRYPSSHRVQSEGASLIPNPPSTLHTDYSYLPLHCLLCKLEV